jgi:hypothetical protein
MRERIDKGHHETKVKARVSLNGIKIKEGET